MMHRICLPLTAAVILLIPLANSFSPASFQYQKSRCISATRFTSPLAAGPKDDLPSSTGPRSESRRSSRTRTQRPERPQRRNPRERNTNDAAPVAIKRAPHQYDHTKAEARPFIDAQTELAKQPSNEDAQPYTLPSSSSEKEITHEHIQFKSLDDLFPNLNFSRKFASSTEFRTELRAAMREDIFDTTPAYAGMSEKARKMLLLPDSSLQGSWKCENGGWEPPAGEEKNENTVRMKKLTEVLTTHLGDDAPTGDEFMDTIGSLCGSKPSTHWIDIVGVLDRRIPHSWHQDTGNSPNGDTFTVLLGFPPKDEYDGIGVYSHLVKLKYEQWAEEGHPPNEPVLYGRMEEMEEEYIIRPRWAEGRELVMYRDVDVLHSSPDVAYRASVMRFM